MARRYIKTLQQKQLEEAWARAGVLSALGVEWQPPSVDEIGRHSSKKSMTEIILEQHRQAGITTEEGDDGGQGHQD